jgi:hypothetical protein
VTPAPQRLVLRPLTCALFCALVLVLLPWRTAAASDAIRATVEPPVIDELDTARLTIRVAGTREAGTLDLGVLREDFDVITTQTASQYRAVNNQVEASVEYQITLRPRRSGDLTIPAIAVAGGTTEPLQLRVRGLDPDLRAAIDRMVFFETELSANPVYVNAQTILVRRLYYSSDAQIYSDLPGLPEIPEAVVMPLGQAMSTVTILDGQRYGVIEQRFAIIPEQSGSLMIPPISVTSSVRLETGGRARRSGVRIGTEAMQVEVLPIPAEYPARQPWLPAEDLVITDEWRPNGAGMEVGDPIDRILRARVTGNVSSIIPPFGADLPERHFRQYPEPPILEDDSDGASVGGTRIQRYSLIPTAPGSVTLPAVEIVWWDVAAHEVRTSRAPPRTLRIAGTAPAPELAPEPLETVSENGAAPPEMNLDVRSEQVPWPGPERRRALWLLLLTGGALVLALGLARRIRRNLASGRTHSEHGRVLERERWLALKDACRGGDQHAMHRALLAYLRTHFAATPAEALRRFRELGHGPLLERLNAALYRPDSDAVVSGRELLRAVRSLPSKRKRGGADPLPALYD